MQKHPVVEEFNIKRPGLLAKHYSVSFACPHCDKPLTAQEEELGKPDYCPLCHGLFKLSDAASSEICQLKTQQEDLQKRQEAMRERQIEFEREAEEKRKREQAQLESDLEKRMAKRKSLAEHLAATEHRAVLPSRRHTSIQDSQSVDYPSIRFCMYFSRGVMQVFLALVILFSALFAAFAVYTFNHSFDFKELLLSWCLSLLFIGAGFVLYHSTLAAVEWMQATADIAVGIKQLVKSAEAQSVNAGGANTRA